MGAEAAPRVVLVVEDESLVRERIADELRTYGWHVLEAASGEDALALTADNQIDVVFTDILLPGHMSGWEIAESLRARVPTANSLHFRPWLRSCAASRRQPFHPQTLPTRLHHRGMLQSHG